MIIPDSEIKKQPLSPGKRIIPNVFFALVLSCIYIFITAIFTSVDHGKGSFSFDYDNLISKWGNLIGLFGSVVIVVYVWRKGKGWKNFLFFLFLFINIISMLLLMSHMQEKEEKPSFDYLYYSQLFFTLFMIVIQSFTFIAIATMVKKQSSHANK